jgi:predicted  nucleic acid-binding Zn ribbon protein
MYVAEVTLRKLPEAPDDKIDHGIYALLGSWNRNGQTLGDDKPIVSLRDRIVLYVSLPESDALKPDNEGQHVADALADLARYGLERPTIRLLGEHLGDGSSLDPCGNGCDQPNSLILYTTFLSMEPPVRCGDCFSPIPLYRLPGIGTGVSRIVSWQATYRALDHLEIASGCGEAAAQDLLSDPHGKHLAESAEVCSTIESATGIPTYRCLTRFAQEQEPFEECPLCKSPWRPGRRGLRIFDYRCDPCRLLCDTRP